MNEEEVRQLEEMIKGEERKGCLSCQYMILKVEDRGKDWDGDQEVVSGCALEEFIQFPLNRYFLVDYVIGHNCVLWTKRKKYE